MPYLEFSLETDPSKRGVTLWDQNRAWAGVNLYVSGKEALLLAMDGRKLHSWPLPEGHDRCEYFELLDDGDMVIVCYGTGLLRLDWSSRVVWEAETTAHHDVHSIGNRLLVPVREEPRRRWRRQVIFDSLVTLDAATGVRLDRWSTWESLDALRHLSERSGLETPLPLWRSFSRTRWDYFHLNTIEVLGDTELGRSDARFQQGNWLVCLRNTDLIVILDRDTREVVWHWGPGVVGRPHMPSQLANGNLLVYDNRSQGKSSRVVEVDPVRQEIVWQYQADPPEAFYSKLQGSSQRLPNGNTLICESEKGRAFEVTPEGEIVWEFFNPDVRNGKRRAVYRVTRMSEERVRELAELARERREG
ncbi:MAG: arylsulfotransferase family protein [Acidobacteriota bacterium]